MRRSILTSTMLSFTWTLAFVGLLAAVDAAVSPIEGPGPCAKFIMDVPYADHGRFYNGIDEIKFTFKASENDVLHKVKNTCKALGTEVAKQTVEACNDNYHNKTKPKLSALGPEVLSPVYATCEGVLDCGPIVFHITQVCDHAMHAHRST